MLKLLIEGTVEALPEDRGLFRLQPHISMLSDGLQQDLTEYDVVISVLENLIVPVSERAEELGDLSELLRLIGDFLYVAFKAEAQTGINSFNILKASWALNEDTCVEQVKEILENLETCLLYTSPSPRDS